MTGKLQIFNLGQEFYHQLGYLDSNFVVKAHYYGYPWRCFKIHWGNIKRKIWLKSKVGVNSLLISTEPVWIGFYEKYAASWYEVDLKRIHAICTWINVLWEQI